ncbi:hypothetical protein CLV35_2996 [Motilibacter peucedani]|uniref:Uncharacterized protein n=1 Tax=Motilibacter peucedani TaxID=598650 RepID=A0A420XN85_9ACTN|nr:hypothetical protein [Motilibacter peucedani]RKS72747.1 hypothetical protein CLV35_2996 [Motilibacter peucedani]
MTAVLLCLHLVAVIVLVGPITVSASVFPRYAGAAAGPSERAPAARAVAGAMHRISRSYALPALAVPVLGIGTATALGVLADAWVLLSMALTAVAAAVLVLAVVPGQRAVLASLDDQEAGTQLSALLGRLRAVTGGFGVLWVAVVVLMVVRPGSSTGV